MSFHENLRYYREKRGYSIKEISEMLKITPNTYAGYEIREREPKYKTLCKLVKILNISSDELLGIKNNILGNKDTDEINKIINDIFADDTVVKFTKIEKDYLYFDVFFYDEKIFTGQIKKTIIFEFVNTVISRQREEYKQQLYQFIKNQLLNAHIEYCEKKMEQYQIEYNLVDFKNLNKDKLISMFPAYFNWSNTLYKLLKIQKDNK